MILQDSEGVTAEDSFTLTVNPTPSFDGKLSRQLYVRVNQVLDYTLPVRDSKDVSVTHSALNTRFCRYSQGTYTFMPRLPEDVGTWVVSGTLSNPWDAV